MNMTTPSEALDQFAKNLFLIIKKVAEKIFFYFSIYKIPLQNLIYMMMRRRETDEMNCILTLPFKMALICTKIVQFLSSHFITINNQILHKNIYDFMVKIMKYSNK